MQISVVIPTYNEVARLPVTVATLASELDDRGVDWEIVITDDGSRDGTAELIEQLAGVDPRVRFVLSAHLGKGSALTAGFGCALGDLVVFLDADLPVEVEDVVTGVAMVEDADLVVGTRRAETGRRRNPQPRRRRLAGALFRAAVRSLGLDATSDPQCGLKVLRREAMAPVIDACVAKGFDHDVEMITRARRSGLRVLELPVSWQHRPGSTVRPLRDGVVTVWALARLALSADPAVGSRWPRRRLDRAQARSQANG